MPQSVEGTLHEFKHGQLHSGKGGPVVHDRRQAIAIALNQGRRAGDKKAPPKPADPAMAALHRAAGKK